MGAVDRSKAERQRQAQILRFWRAVEYFSPPKVDPANPRKNLLAVGPNRPLPWEPDSVISRTQSRPSLVWQHTFYAGIFAVDKVRDVLLQAFRAPESEQDFDGRTGGDRWKPPLTGSTPALTRRSGRRACTPARRSTAPRREATMPQRESAV